MIMGVCTTCGKKVRRGQDFHCPHPYLTPPSSKTTTFEQVTEQLHALWELEKAIVRERTRVIGISLSSNHRVTAPVEVANFTNEFEAVKKICQ